MSIKKMSIIPVCLVAGGLVISSCDSGPRALPKKAKTAASAGATLDKSGQIVASAPAVDTAPEFTPKWFGSVYSIKKKQSTEKRPVLVLFTAKSSDEDLKTATEVSKKVNKEIINTKEFSAYSDTGFYATNTTIMSASVKADKYAKQFRIKTYPTLAVLDGDMNICGRITDFSGGTKAVISKIEAIKADSGPIDNGITTTPDEDGWYCNYEMAKARAKALDSHLLALFTNPNDGGYDARIKEKILSDRHFQHFANNSLVLFKADKSVKSEDGVRNQNRALAKELGVKAFGTFVLLNPSFTEKTPKVYKGESAKAMVKLLAGMIGEGAEFLKKEAVALKARQQKEAKLSKIRMEEMKKKRAEMAAKRAKVLAKFSTPNEHGWILYYDAAVKEAKSSGKPLVCLFTGSDWCQPCMMFERDVLSQKFFLDYAKENLVLFMADFPRRKSIDSTLKAYNQELMSDFGLTGFPSMIIVDPATKKVKKKIQRGATGDAFLNQFK